MSLLKYFPPGTVDATLSYPRHVSRPRAPPIKMQGIKTRLVTFIGDNIKWDGKGTWHDFFIGSGCVLFNMTPRKAIVSDINPHVVAFYNAVKNGSITARSASRFLKDHGKKLSKNGDSYYYDMRDAFNQDYDPLHFLFLTRSCFNGLMRFNKKGGFNSPFCKKVNRFDQSLVTKITNQLRWVERLIHHHDYKFTCRDWKDAVSSIKIDAGDHVYLDPPYSGRDTGYFTRWEDPDDDELVKFVASSPCPVMLSTWKCDAMKENPFYYKVVDAIENARVVLIDHEYQVGAKVESRNVVTEALVIKDAISRS
jgi:DNA adenine methylase